MRVLLAHNYTKGFATGGEGHVFEDEAELLTREGHVVQKLFCSNSEAAEASIWGKVQAFWNAPWSKDGYRRMADAIRQFKPDVVHVHNFFLILSPSIFKAAHDLNVPVVLTLHNYRMVAPCSQLLRGGRICELCVGRNPWRIMFYRCYKHSFWASLLRYRIYYLSRIRYQWDQYVDAFAALTSFGREKLIESGLPADRVRVVPNCVPDRFLGGKEDGSGGKSHGALFLGTVTHDKGVRELIETWKEIDYTLTVVGDGALRKRLESLNVPHVRFVGVQTRDAVTEFLRGCSFLIMPSLWYEGFGLVLTEAMSMSRAVIASGHGAMASIVKDGVTGLHFRPGDVADLRRAVRKLIDDSDLAARMGRSGRDEYLMRYTPEKHYEALCEVYESVLMKRGDRW